NRFTVALASVIGRLPLSRARGRGAGGEGLSGQRLDQHPLLPRPPPLPITWQRFRARTGPQKRRRADVRPERAGRVLPPHQRLRPPLRPPASPAALGRAAPLAGPESEPARDEAAVPRPGPPACPVEAARDGEVHVRALVVGAASDELDPRTEPCPGSAAGGLR